MLRIVVYVNKDKIDEIRIRNTMIKNDKGENKYILTMPKGYGSIEVWHDRIKPWHILVEKVLYELNKTNYNNIINRTADKIIRYVRYQENNKKNKGN